MKEALAMLMEIMGFVKSHPEEIAEIREAVAVTKGLAAELKAAKAGAQQPTA